MNYNFRDSGFSGIVESVDSIQETPLKITVQIKEPIKKITIVDDYENEDRGKNHIENSFIFIKLSNYLFLLTYRLL